ncbi:fasciclin domain-containing protein [Cumulibacter manganitolerans]|uniref:fasciclin domain-containing protein n=1 Tax=Cumulibacter manganitolerans TaxID=1884992 RepID=UPI001885FE2D|nr:fasciclin domain-containing protein [Cumulibacter manganitolerans]
MTYLVRRVVGCLMLLGVLSACGGPGGAVSSAATTSGTPTRSAPPASGAGCAEAGELGDLADKGFVDALKKIPTTSTFATYAALDPTRAKKLNALQGVTAFVPVDSAWSAVDATQAQQLADPAWQGAAVEYALVPQTVLPEDVAAGKTGAMPTYRAVGATLAGGRNGDSIVLNGVATVICGPVAFGGGLLYLTDRVLLPSS